jgi:hypothetical protein
MNAWTAFEQANPRMLLRSCGMRNCAGLCKNRPHIPFLWEEFWECCNILLRPLFYLFYFCREDLYALATSTYTFLARRESNQGKLICISPTQMKAFGGPKLIWYTDDFFLCNPASCSGELTVPGCSARWPGGGCWGRNLQANGGRGEMEAMGSSPAVSALRSSSTGMSNCAARRGAMEWIVVAGNGSG